MEKILSGDYTYDEFYAMIVRWRERYQVNKNAILPPITSMRFVENKRILFLKDKVHLEDI